MRSNLKIRAPFGKDLVINIFYIVETCNICDPSRH